MKSNDASSLRWSKRETASKAIPILLISSIAIYAGAYTISQLLPVSILIGYGITASVVAPAIVYLPVVANRQFKITSYKNSKRRIGLIKDTSIIVLAACLPWALAVAVGLSTSLAPVVLVISILGGYYAFVKKNTSFFESVPNFGPLN